jgi:hypothetical protein
MTRLRDEMMIRKSERYCTAGTNLVVVQYSTIVVIILYLFSNFTVINLKKQKIILTAASSFQSQSQKNELVDPIELMVSARYVFSVCCDLKMLSTHVRTTSLY